MTPTDWPQGRVPMQMPIDALWKPVRMRTREQSRRHPTASGARWNAKAETTTLLLKAGSDRTQGTAMATALASCRTVEREYGDDDGSLKAGSGEREKQGWRQPAASGRRGNTKLRFPRLSECRRRFEREKQAGDYPRIVPRRQFQCRLTVLL